MENGNVVSGNCVKAQLALRRCCYWMCLLTTQLAECAPPSPVLECCSLHPDLMFWHMASTHAVTSMSPDLSRCEISNSQYLIISTHLRNNAQITSPHLPNSPLLSLLPLPLLALLTLLLLLL